MANFGKGIINKTGRYTSHQAINFQPPCDGQGKEEEKY